MSFNHFQTLRQCVVMTHLPAGGKAKPLNVAPNCGPHPLKALNEVKFYVRVSGADLITPIKLTVFSIFLYFKVIF